MQQKGMSNTNSSANNELFEYNDKIASEKIYGVLGYLNIIIPFLFLGVLVKSFDATYKDCFILSCILAFLTFIEHILCESEKFYKAAKWFGLIALHIFICSLGSIFHIEVVLLYCIVPIMSCLYFDKEFTLKISGICYLFMIYSLFQQSLNVTGNVKAIDWFLITGSMYTFEYFLMAIVLTVVSDTVNNIVNRINSQNESIRQMQMRVVMGFADLVESRDKNTGQHIKRTSEYVSLIIEQLKKNGKHTDELNDKQVKMIIETAPLHDVGKIAIPDSVLCKPGKLTDKEYNIIKTHTLRGAEIIENDLNLDDDDEFYTMARNMALYHHERWDGTGYPCRIKGESIPLCARIMAAADVLDALLSKRSYKEEFSLDKAFDIIKNGSGTQFEPCIVEAVMQLRPQIEELNKQ
jgi:HD-GYP domain-containing protein (c-di-GMP phosphodiesterase class II)